MKVGIVKFASQFCSLLDKTKIFWLILTQILNIKFNVIGLVLAAV
jgi:hypothetical protein